MSKSETTNDSLGEIHNGLAGIETDSTGARNEGLELEREKARRLAKSVAMASAIPADGDDFVYFIGSGDEKDNIEALTTLILLLADKIEMMKAMQKVEYLIDWLEANLGHVTKHVE